MTYETGLTEKFKEIIRNELYDTGALYLSLEIFSYSLPGQVFFDIQCEEYIIYHIDRLNLLTRLSGFPEFQSAYEIYVKENIEAVLRQRLSGSTTEPVSENIIPTCFILVNGV
jgi:hypothetical protein